MRRTVWLIVGCLLCGVAATIGVAWVLALTIDFDEYEVPETVGGVHSEGRYWHVTLRRTLGGLEISKLTLDPAQKSPFPIERYWVEEARTSVRHLLPAWSTANLDPDSAEGRASGGWEERAYGWPRLALRTAVDSDKVAALQPGYWEALGSPTPIVDGDRLIFVTPAHGTVVVYESIRDGGVRHGWLWSAEKDGVTPTSLRAIVLPLQPMWSGLALNTAFYAVVALALWFVIRAPMLLRRSWRTAHRRCARCGYDMTHSPDTCPECGALQEQPGRLFTAWRKFVETHWPPR